MTKKEELEIAIKVYTEDQKRFCEQNKYPLDSPTHFTRMIDLHKKQLAELEDSNG